MLLRTLAALTVLGVVMATPDDVISRDYDVIPLDIYPDIGEYFYLGVQLNWTEAVLACRSSFAHLLIIDSDAEGAAVREMMTKYSAANIHLGFHDQWQEGKYNTIFGETISSACNAGFQWAPGSPRGGLEFNCGGFSDTGFTDIRCSDRRVIICELNQPDEGSQLADYTLLPDFGYYKFYDTNYTVWTEADETCREDGAQLVVLNSQDELDAIMDGFNLSYPFDFHVGVHRFFGGNDDYITVAGTPLNDTGYTRWYNDGWEPYGTFLDFPYITFFAPNASLYGIATVNSTFRQYFICEHDLL